MTESVNRLFDGYQYGEAGRQVHDFLWGDFADWYLELAKVQLQQDPNTVKRTLAILFEVLDRCLRFLHPYMPFVTEETWKHLKSAFIEADVGIQPQEGWSEALMLAQWPKSHVDRPFTDVDEFERIRELVRGIRAVRSEYSVDPGKRLPAELVVSDKEMDIRSQIDVIAFLARLDEKKIKVVDSGEGPDDSVTVTVGELTAYLPLANLIDFEQERMRLEKEIKELDGQIERVSKLLNSEFASKAPADVVQREREKLSRYETSRSELSDQLEHLK